MSKEISTYVDGAMFEAKPMQADQRGGRVLPKVTLVNASPDPLGAIAAACRMYEGKPTYTLEDVTDAERAHYWEQVKRTHLKAPLEFVDLHFFVEGVTRAFTHQMVRQRTAVFAQESLRFAVKEDMADEVGLPPSITKGSEEAGVWHDVLERVEAAYKWLIGQGVPAEDARGLLPHQVTTRLNYKTNLRNLLDHAGNRLCTQAQFEWRLVFAGILAAMRNREADSWQWEMIVEDDVFKPVCFSLGKCPFTADFDRGCTIRDRVEAGKFEEISTKEWAADPKAGWVK